MIYEKRLLYSLRNRIVAVAIYVDGYFARRFEYTPSDMKECNRYLEHLRHRYGARRLKRRG